MAVKLTEAEEAEIKNKAYQKLKTMTQEEISKEAKGNRVISIVLSVGTFLIGVILGIVTIDDSIGGGVFCIVVGTVIASFGISTVFQKNEKIVLDSLISKFRTEMIQVKKGLIKNPIFNLGEFSETELKTGFQISKNIILTNQGYFSNNDVRSAGRILLDEKKRQIIFQKGVTYTKAFGFADIIKYEIYEDEQNVVQGRVGSALVGGLFFGVEGAIIGASGKREINKRVNILKLIVYVNDLDCPKVEFAYINSAILKNSIEYVEMIKNLQDVSGYLEYIMNNVSYNTEKEAEGNTVQVQEISKKEQLEELKALLSDGLITEEDFEQKKKQILGL